MKLKKLQISTVFEKKKVFLKIVIPFSQMFLLIVVLFFENVKTMQHFEASKEVNQKAENFQTVTIFVETKWQKTQKKFWFSNSEKCDSRNMKVETKLTKKFAQIRRILRTFKHFFNLKTHGENKNWMNINGNLQILAKKFHSYLDVVLERKNKVTQPDPQSYVADDKFILAKPACTRMNCPIVFLPQCFILLSCFTQKKRTKKNSNGR